MDKTPIKLAFRDYWNVLKCAGTAFMNDNALKMCASLAYYTIFAMAPLIMILVTVASFVLGAESGEKIFSEMNQFVGRESTNQIREIVDRTRESQSSTFAIIAGTVTLLVGATGVFLEMQDSINRIWRVKAKPKKGWLKMLKDRLLSFSLIIGVGFLLIVSLVVNGIVLAISERLTQMLPDITVVFVHLINGVLTFIIIALLFAIIFKFLPDVNIRWSTVKKGAIFTALLFMIGKYLIGLYLGFSNPASTYGAAGALILILVWVYYTSAILFFGAEFTQVYAEAVGARIEPSKYAVHVEVVEEEKDVDVIPSQKHDL